VNDADEVQRLLDLGTDGIITDRVDLFSPGK
jgi:glycerophosphoryl diester phosphodiesterase